MARAERTTQRWEEQALCATLVNEGHAKSDWWHPVTKGADKAAIRTATEICKQCPVWRECRRFADDTGVVGVWGGVLYVRSRQVAK